MVYPVIPSPDYFYLSPLLGSEPPSQGQQMESEEVIEEGQANFPLSPSSILPSVTIESENSSFPSRQRKRKETSLISEDSKSQSEASQSLLKKEFARIKRKEKQRLYSKEYRDQKKLKLEKLLENRNHFLQSVQQIESLVQSYSEAFPQSTLKWNPTLQTKKVTPQLGIEQAVKIYQQRMAQAIETIIQDALTDQQAYHTKCADLEKKIKQLEIENALLEEREGHSPSGRSSSKG